MCDFKVGDEVVCVKMTSAPEMVGGVYEISGVYKSVFGLVGIFLKGEQNEGPGWLGWLSENFRKVQRRDLTEWLSSSVGNTDKIDKRKRVNA